MVPARQTWLWTKWSGLSALIPTAESLDRIAGKSPEQALVLIVGSGINFIDVAGCEMLAEETYQRRNQVTSCKP